MNITYPAPLAADVIAQYPELHPVIIQILQQRGIQGTEAIERFLHPDYLRDQHDPWLFRDMKKTIDRILAARDQSEPVLVYGDYDADGVCSTVLLHSALQQAGLTNVSMYLPHRDTEGYGLNNAAITKFVEQGIKLIITVDCGISNAPEVAFAADQGIDVIVTDHHAEPNVLPSRAYAIINPQLHEDTYPFALLAGVGVAFKVALALGRTLKLGESFEKWLLDLVAISTVTDCMPLLDENRTLVHYGLIVLNKTRRLGLQSLIAATHKPGAIVNTVSIGYRIGPWINAAGRIDHANMAVKLLLADSDAVASEYVKKLEETNTSRQAQTETMFKEANLQAEAQPDNAVICTFGKDWPLGLVGLVAGKLVNAFHKPNFVLTENKGVISGSGRSVKGVNMIVTLQHMDQLLSRYGGHAMACGFSLKPDVTIEEFRETFTRTAATDLAKVDNDPPLEVAAELKLSDITWDLVEHVNLLQPFGEKNPEPLFYLRTVTLKDYQAVGVNSKHIRMRLTDSTGCVIRAIAFGAGKSLEQFQIGKTLDVVCTLGINEWNGQRDLQVTINQFEFNQ